MFIDNTSEDAFTEWPGNAGTSSLHSNGGYIKTRCTGLSACKGPFPRHVNAFAMPKDLEIRSEHTLEENTHIQCFTGTEALYSGMILYYDV